MRVENDQYDYLKAWLHYAALRMINNGEIK